MLKTHQTAETDQRHHIALDSSAIDTFAKVQNILDPLKEQNKSINNDTTIDKHSVLR